MARSTSPSRVFAPLGLIFAIAALLVQTLVPAGYMASTSRTGPALVICTGHGALDLTPRGAGGDHKSHKPGDASVCAFAAHGLTNSPPAPVIVMASRYAAPLQLAASARAQSPGRGLAAPPPPSQGPPTLS